MKSTPEDDPEFAFGTQRYLFSESYGSLACPRAQRPPAAAWVPGAGRLWEEYVSHHVERPSVTE